MHVRMHTHIRTHTHPHTHTHTLTHTHTHSHTHTHTHIHTHVFTIVSHKQIFCQTSPIWWYFTSALPRALLASLPLVFWGLYRDRRSWTFIAPAVGFVALYSLLPHKELRFIMYSVPLFNLVAAQGYVNM